MNTITLSGQPATSIGQVPGFIRKCWYALQQRRKRQQVRSALYALDGCALKDIGIAYGEIEYVSSNLDIDPRGTCALPS